MPSAPSTTWSFVRMKPSLSTMKPDPRLCCLRSRSGICPKKWLKKSSSPPNGIWPRGPRGTCCNRRLNVFVVLMFTTNFFSSSAIFAKLKPGSCASAGAVPAAAGAGPSRSAAARAGAVRLSREASTMPAASDATATAPRVSRRLKDVVIFHSSIISFWLPSNAIDARREWKVPGSCEPIRRPCASRIARVRRAAPCDPTARARRCRSRARDRASAPWRGRPQPAGPDPAPAAGSRKLVLSNRDSRLKPSPKTTWISP